MSDILSDKEIRKFITPASEIPECFLNNGEVFDIPALLQAQHRHTRSQIFKGIGKVLDKLRDGIDER